MALSRMWTAFKVGISTGMPCPCLSMWVDDLRRSALRVTLHAGRGSLGFVFFPRPRAFLALPWRLRLPTVEVTVRATPDGPNSCRAEKQPLAERTACCSLRSLTANLQYTNILMSIDHQLHVRGGLEHYTHRFYIA